MLRLAEEREREAELEEAVRHISIPLRERLRVLGHVLGLGLGFSVWVSISVSVWFVFVLDLRGLQEDLVLRSEARRSEGLSVCVEL